MTVASFSRLGTSNMYSNALQNIQERQASLANLQESLTSGKRVNNPSDDPTAAAQAERALTRISRIATDQRALEAQRNSITVAESTLGDVVNALQNFREAVVGASNGSNTTADRKTYATQLSSYRDQILALVNKTDSNGLPLFGGLGSAVTPFVGPLSGTPDYSFNGLPGQTAAGETSIPNTIDGDAAFMHQASRDGAYNVTVALSGTASRSFGTDPVSMTDPTLVNGASYTIDITGVDSTTTPGTTTVTYNITASPASGGSSTGLTGSFLTGKGTGFTVTGMPGLSLKVNGTPAVGDQIAVAPSPSVFSTLDQAITGIGNAANSNAASQAARQALANIDIALQQVSSVRGRAGELLNRADTITGSNEKRSIQQEADRSRAQDVDMVKAISDFQNQNTAYSAALQSYAQVQKLSLFNFIG